jgi:hypothetical protein
MEADDRARGAPHPRTLGLVDVDVTLTGTCHTDGPAPLAKAFATLMERGHATHQDGARPRGPSARKNGRARLRRQSALGRRSCGRDLRIAHRLAHTKRGDVCAWLEVIHIPRRRCGHDVRGHNRELCRSGSHRALKVRTAHDKPSHRQTISYSLRSFDRDESARHPRKCDCGNAVALQLRRPRPWWCSTMTAASPMQERPCPFIFTSKRREEIRGYSSRIQTAPAKDDLWAIG